jgi:hypothetical protein
MTVGDSTITPVARSLVTRWPGGGSVWSEPAAVIVERDGRNERIPIANLNGRVLQAMRVGALTASTYSPYWIGPRSFRLL